MYVVFISRWLFLVLVVGGSISFMVDVFGWLVVMFSMLGNMVMGLVGGVVGGKCMVMVEMLFWCCSW